MLKRISILFLICFVSFSTFAQTEKYTVPVKWERYKVGEQDVSISLPKLPVLFETNNVCAQQVSRQYATFADQTIYGLTIISKAKEPLPKSCGENNGFNEKSFEKRLSEFRNPAKAIIETNFKLNDFTVNKFSEKQSIYWLINDYRHKRWFEIWTVNGTEEKSAVKDYIKSVEIKEGVSGIEIGNGADRTFGDEATTDTKNSKENITQNSETAPIMVVVKPMPKYTDAAKKANTEGTVTLKVVFLANGGIGNIITVNELPYGLTEQAIRVAQQLVFIPPRRNGIPYAVIKTITYNFSIY